MGYQDCFKRVELKYQVSARQKRVLLDAMREHMRPDEFGKSTICNLYFDTPDYLLIRRSLEKPVYKEKLRLRSYGVAQDDSQVFLELKKKYKGVVYKRRIAMDSHAAMDALLRGKKLQSESQIAHEIEAFRSFYRELSPAVYLSYEREAFYGKDDHDLRITFDERILWRQQDMDLRIAPYGSPILPPGQSLMEIKIAGAMPLWLVRLLSENGIYQTSFSKYGNAYQQMLKNEYYGGQMVC